MWALAPGAAAVGTGQTVGTGNERVPLNGGGIALEDVVGPASVIDLQTACADVQSPCQSLPACGDAPSLPSL